MRQILTAVFAFCIMTACTSAVPNTVAEAGELDESDIEAMNLLSSDLEALAITLDEEQVAGTLEPELVELWRSTDAGYQSVAVDSTGTPAAVRDLEQNVQAFGPMLNALAERDGAVPESVREALAAIRSDLDYLDDRLVIDPVTPLGLRRDQCCMFFYRPAFNASGSDDTSEWPFACDTITATRVGAGIRCGLRSWLGIVHKLEVHGGSCREQEACYGVSWW